MVTRMRYLWLLVLPLMLAGCVSMLDTGKSNTPAAAPSGTALQTQIAATVHAAVAATQTAQPHQQQLATVLVVASNTPVPTGTSRATAVAVASSTPRPSPTSPPATAMPTGTALPTQTPRATATPTATSTPTATLMPTPVILPPVQLAEAELGGGVLKARYWTNTRGVTFSIAAPPGVSPSLRPEIELQPLSHAYTGKPTASGATLVPDKVGLITVSVVALPEGPYHWQARLSDGAGHNGPWTDYYPGPAFRLDRTPPAAPVISSSTHPDQHATYSAPMAKLSWTKPEDNGGIQGYRTGIDRKPNGQPDSTLGTIANTVIGPLASGDLYFHVQAVDWAGNKGAIATYTLHIDHRAPTLAHVTFDRFQFNPQYDKLTMHFTPNKTVTVKVEILRQSTKGLVRILNLGSMPAGKPATIAWDGRNASGVLVKPDKYTMTVYITDQLGNVGSGFYSQLGVIYKRIVVHLQTQRVDVYDGNTLLRSSLVTTGNQQLPTPPGIWHITGKFHPYKFISPWKKGSPYYYPPSDVNYAMYFHEGGYFLHDAPWRTVFGPGTNTAPGLPGSGIYSGTHGCVEMPTDFAQWLFKWAPNGTVVDIRQ